MIIVESVKDIKKVEYEFYYIKDLNICMHVSSALKIVDLTNAMKRGKLVKQYITTENDFNDFRDFINNRILNNMLEDTIKSIMSNNYTYEVILDVRKGIKVFTPFKEQKKIEIPSKPKINDIVKAILSQQITEGKKIASYSDDFYADYKENFNKDKPLDLMEMCKELVEEPNGWWCYINKVIDDSIIFSVNCYSFDKNKLIFKF